MLQLFDQDFWLAIGDPVAVMGFRYPTRMAVIRLRDGGLFVWSPIALTDALRLQVADIGPVRWLVAPNSLHHLALADWAAAFPLARVFAPPGLRAKRKDIAFDADLGAAADADWAGQIDQVLVRGNLITTESVFFHRASATVLITDLVQSFPPDWFQGWRASIARMDRMVAPEPEMPRKFRAAFVNRAAARAAVTPLLAWPAQNLILAHGAPVRGDAQALLQRAFGWLVG